MQRGFVCHKVKLEKLLDDLLALGLHAIRESLRPHFGQCTAFRGGAVTVLETSCIGCESSSSAPHSGHAMPDGVGRFLLSHKRSFRALCSRRLLSIPTRCRRAADYDGDGITHEARDTQARACQIEFNRAGCVGRQIDT